MISGELEIISFMFVATGATFFFLGFVIGLMAEKLGVLEDTAKKRPVKKKK